MRYVLPLNSNSSSTDVCVSSAAKSLRSIALFSLSCPLAVPYKAKQMPSKIVVFPAPVFPEITNKRLSSSSRKSMISVSLYGPNAVIVNFNGITLNAPPSVRSEEHTSELQSRGHLVCSLLLEKKKKDIETS